MTMENKNPLRTLYVVQLVTIIILLMLLINTMLPFFGIMPIGGHMQRIGPGGPGISAPGNGGYSSPSN
jgi:hypothetical protein